MELKKKQRRECNSYYISDIDHLQQFIFNNCLGFEQFSTNV